MAFNDLDLMALVYMLAAEVEARAQEFPAVSRVVKGWVEDLPLNGPGTIDLQLDERIATEQMRFEMQRLMRAVAARLPSFGNAVPAAALNRRCNVPGVRFLDYPVSLIESALAELSSLIGT